MKVYETYANGKTTGIIDSRRDLAEAHIRHMNQLRAMRGEKPVRYTIKEKWL